MSIVIVGAGAAGLAAARALRVRGHSPLVLEARDRVGGRAWTDTATFGVPVDFGCAWLHSADLNPWTALAREHGVELIERSPTWRRRIGRNETSDDYQAAWRRAFERNAELIVGAANAARDVAVSELVPNDRHRPMFDCVMRWLMGADSERVSSLDYARYGDNDVNWAVPRGLGMVVALAAQGIDVRLATRVTEIDWRGSRPRVATPAGSIDADAVIITVSTNVLASGALRFTPALSPRFDEAFAGVPVGLADKVFFELRPGAMPFAGSQHFVRTDTTNRIGGYQTRPGGQELLSGYFGGSLALELEDTGAMESFAREELREVFGNDFTHDIVRSTATAWAHDPYARGAYSVALPGKAHLRAQLSEPVGSRVFFAGEACSIDRFGTIFGAWESGVAAAKRALNQDPDSTRRFHG